jgi:hypothetical protein
MAYSDTIWELDTPNLERGEQFRQRNVGLNKRRTGRDTLLWGEEKNIGSCLSVENRACMGPAGVPRN